MLLRSLRSWTTGAGFIRSISLPSLYKDLKVPCSAVAKSASSTGYERAVQTDCSDGTIGRKLPLESEQEARSPSANVPVPVRSTVREGQRNKPV